MSIFLSKNADNFIKVATAGSFKEAARLANLSQPALSISIKNLENEIGCALFLRQKKNAELTEKGQALYAKLLDLKKTITDETEAILKGSPMPRLRIGSVPWFANLRLLPLVRSAEFRSVYDHGQFFLRPAGVLCDAVQKRWLDFAFLNWPEKPPGLASCPILQDPAVIGGHKSKFKHITSAKSYKDLEDEKWIYGEGRGSNWTEAIEWDKSGFVISDIYSLRFLILGGYGIYEFQLSYFSKKERSQIAIASFPARYRNNRIYAVWRQDLSKEKKMILDQMVPLLVHSKQP